MFAVKLEVFEPAAEEQPFDKLLCGWRRFSGEHSFALRVPLLENAGDVWRRKIEKKGMYGNKQI